MNLLKRGAVLAGLLVALAGCGDQVGTSSESTSDRTAQQRGDAIVAKISGTANQRDAAYFLDNYWLNQPVKECMAELGFQTDYPAPKDFPHAWAGYVPDGGGGSTWLGSLWNRQVSEKLLLVANSDPGELQAAQRIDDPSEDPRPKYDEAMTSCEESRVWREAEPKSGGALAAKFVRLVDSVDDELGSAEAYDTCMGDHGFDLSAYDASGFGDLYMYLTEMAPSPEEAPVGAEEATAVWKDFVALETKALAADDECRRDRYEEGWDRLAPLLQQFADEHRQALTDLQHEWDQAEEKARDLGYTSYVS